MTPLMPPPPPFSFRQGPCHCNLCPVGSEPTSHFTEQPQDRALHMQTPTSTTNTGAPGASDRMRLWPPRPPTFNDTNDPGTCSDM
ncbi:hypothetical protein BDZ97DRAFT_1825705 [Flammula alnicola]|nr:hypothetical protein BDZ97DRAFT_1825705 [Flammula alnicola]